MFNSKKIKQWISEIRSPNEQKITKQLHDESCTKQNLIDDTIKYNEKPQRESHELSSLSQTEKKTKVVPFEDYALEFHTMASQDSYDGFRAESMKNITPYLLINQSLILGSSMIPNNQLYQVGTTFSNKDESLMAMARYGNDGTMSLRAVKKFKNSLEAKLTSTSSLVDPNRNMIEAGINMYRNKYCISSKFAWQGTPVTSFEISQLITRNLHCGCQYTSLAATGAGFASIGFRYMLRNHLLTGSICRQPELNALSGKFQNMHTANLIYFRKVSDRLSLGTELGVTQDHRELDSTLRVAYEYTFRQARVQGSLSAAGNACMTALTASGFGVCANIDFWRGIYKFGIMLQSISQST